MAMPSSPSARLFYRTAQQRFEDAEFLLNVGRTTAAVYLAGYSVECMLKALILASVPRGRESEVERMFRGIRAHDYDWLLRLYDKQRGAGLPVGLVPHFTRVNTWSTDMRYSPGTATLRESKAFLESAVAILNWGDGRLS